LSITVSEPGGFRMRWRTLRGLKAGAWLVVALLCTARFWALAADFPNNSPWMVDQAKFTDEGWWAQGAVNRQLLGRWNVPGDYNPSVAVPVWPMLLDGLFRISGVSVVAARALTAAFSVATLGLVFVLVWRCAGAMRETWATSAVLLLAGSPFALAFSRLAILETPVIFEFCLLLWLAGWGRSRSAWSLCWLPLPVAFMILTKTTAALMLPAIFWVAWIRQDARPSTQRWTSSLSRFLATGVTVIAVPLALVRGYAVLVTSLGYGADYDYFFGVNAMPDIDWSHAGSTLADLARNCFWVDRTLYPLGVLALGVSLFWRRRLWSNPLYAASWIAIAAQGAFIFSRQDDYAPRYFLMMLVPLILVVILTMAEIAGNSRRWAIAGCAVLAVLFALNAATDATLFAHPQFQFEQAARSIQRTIRSHPEQPALILGVSGSQLSLMTGIPSINDAYGTMELKTKVQSYHPGWYVAWNGVGDDIREAMAPRQFEKIESHPVFDDDTRNLLILYKITPR
jgi:hypothetical protein